MRTFKNIFFILIFITPLFSDEVTLLNAIVSDFQVNENSDLSIAAQDFCSISADDSGNEYLMYAWVLRILIVFAVLTAIYIALSAYQRWEELEDNG